MNCQKIVRCRDCKHSIHFFHHDDERWQCTEPYQEGDDVKPDAYCWRGKRKDGGEIDELMRKKDASDNRTTEPLCKLLEDRGIKWEEGDAAYEIEWSTPDGRHCSAMYWKPTFTVLISGCTPEQAIVATLGSDKPPYDELLRCLENDWHISASWDGLRKFWCVELTEEGVRMRDAHDEALCRIAALEELVWFMVPFFGSACSHECGCPDDYFEPHGCDDGCKAWKELNERMKELGIEVDR